MRRYLWLLTVLVALLLIYVFVFSRPFWTGFFGVLGTGIGMLIADRLGWTAKKPGETAKKPTDQPDR
ncbi:hypothetical protein [Micromonospora sp. DT233]|uniref:hypothetical protein n=1 Tax=Micromonospora sp. DT233 TaxID=3393432 RepID=UPI003CF75BBA